MTYMNGFSARAKGVTATALVLILALLAFHLFARNNQTALDASIERQSQHSQNYRQYWQQKGILSASDYARLNKISTYIQQRQTLSEDDLDFWIALLQRGPLRDTPGNRMLFYTDVMGEAVGRKYLNPSEQGKMYAAVLPFVSDQAYPQAVDPTDTETDASDPTTQANLRTGEEQIAIQLLAQTRDPRALNVLKGIAQNNPSPVLRQTAQDYYGKLVSILSPKPLL